MVAGISVVIRTFNSSKTLLPLLEKLHLADNDELICVDSGSEDSTLLIAERFNAQVIKPEGGFNYSKALNIGFEAAKNPWVLALSSHVTPFADDILAVYRSALSIADEETGLLYGGSILTFNEWNRIRQLPDQNLKSYEDLTVVPYRAGNANALYRKSIWELHHFDEELPTGEDLEWQLWLWNKRYQSSFIPSATCLYKNQGSLVYMFRKGYKEAQIHRRMIKGLPPRKTLRTLILGILHYIKKVIFEGLSPMMGLRVCAHYLGVFCSSFPKATTSK